MAQKAKKENTLGDFVEDNSKLLSAVGLFTALTVFSSTLEPRVVGAFLSFLFLSATVVLWFELMEKFPAGTPATGRLTWFETILSFAMLVVVFYWLLQFRGFWRSWLIIPIALILAAIVSGVLKRFDVFNRAFAAKPGEKRRWRYFVAFSVFAVSILGAIYLSALIVQRIGPPLDTLRQVLEEMPLEVTPSPIP